MLRFGDHNHVFSTFLTEFVFDKGKKSVVAEAEALQTEYMSIQMNVDKVYVNGHMMNWTIKLDRIV